MIPQCNSKRVVVPYKPKLRPWTMPGARLINFYVSTSTSYAALLTIAWQMPYLNYESIKTWKEHQDRVQTTVWFDRPIESHLTDNPDASKPESSESPVASSSHSQLEPATTPLEKPDNTNKLSDAKSHTTDEDRVEKRKEKSTHVTESPSKPEAELIPEGETMEKLKGRDPEKSLLEAYLYQQHPLHLRQ